MKLNINFITFLSITLVLCFAICIAHAEEPQSEPPPTDSPAEPATGVPESEEPASEEPASADPASADAASADPASEGQVTEGPASAEPALENQATEGPASEDSSSAATASDEPLVDPTTANPTFIDPSLADPPSEDSSSGNPVVSDPETLYGDPAKWESQGPASANSALEDPEKLYGDPANWESADPPSEDPESADPPSGDPALEDPASEDASLADAPSAESQWAEAPWAESPFANGEEQVEEGFFSGSGGGHLRKAFSSFFAEIRMGSLRGSKTITMLNHFNRHDRDSVKEICSRTDYPDDCLSTVVPFLGNKFDLMSVLEAAIKACSFQTNFTISIVDKHMQSSPEMATALATCKEQYTTALQSLQHASNALPSHDIATVTVMLSSVMADVSACESGFEDLKVSMPRSRSEGMVSVTASNCLSIASMIPS